MKNFCKIFVLLLALITCAVLPLTGCGNSGDVHNLNMVGTVYSHGTNIVEITFDEKSEDASEFDSKISAKDIKLKGAVAGKTVSSVEFVNKTTIKVTLTGKVTANLEKDNVGEIVVSSNVVKNGYNSHAVFTVSKSTVMSGGGISSASGNLKKGTVTLNAYGCEFSESISASDITLKDIPTAEITNVERISSTEISFKYGALNI